MDIRILTIEEFADQLQVSRTTVFEWIRKGHLANGRHYFRINRTIRFPWGEDLISLLMEDCKTLGDLPGCVSEITDNESRLHH